MVGNYQQNQGYRNEIATSVAIGSLSLLFTMAVAAQTEHIVFILN